MIRIIITLLLVLCSGPVAYAATTTSTTTMWNVVGNNPCAGECDYRTTLEYMAKHENWPADAVAHLRQEFAAHMAELEAGVAPADIGWERLDITRGTFGVVSFAGDRQQPNTEARFDRTEAYGVSYEAQNGHTYTLRYVITCGNFFASDTLVHLEDFKRLASWDDPTAVKHQDSPGIDWSQFGGASYFGGGNNFSNITHGDVYVFNHYKHHVHKPPHHESEVDDQVTPVSLPAGLPLLAGGVIGLWALRL